MIYHVIYKKKKKNISKDINQYFLSTERLLMLLSQYVCMYVCMHACIRVRMHAYASILIYINT